MARHKRSAKLDTIHRSRGPLWMVLCGEKLEDQSQIQAEMLESLCAFMAAVNFVVLASSSLVLIGGFQSNK